MYIYGRIYDPTLGRFLQADPFVQAPGNSQSYNRYSYVLNNPLSYTDPSGYFFSKLWKEIKPFVGAIAGIVVAAYCPACTASFWAAAGTGAAIGAGSAAINGGNILKGALIGAFSGAAFQQIGAHFTGALEGGLGHVLAHGITGGVTSVLRGGKFGHGFISAGLTKALNINKLVGTAAEHDGLRVAVAAVVGGTISKISGGKFANGAITAAFAQAFNGNGAAKRDRNNVKFQKFITRLKELQKQSSGKVFKDIGFTDKEIELFELYNACSTRVSVALNENGGTIGPGFGFNPSGDNIITSVNSLSKYLAEAYGVPDVSISGDLSNVDLSKSFGKQQGILLFTSSTGGAAENHATAWESGATYSTDGYSSDSAQYYDKVEFWSF